MSIAIKLYTFSKKENSTKVPSGNGTTFNCLVKTPSSLMNPYIELESSTNPVAYNYAYIADFNRYYFVNDWRFDRGLWYATLNVDVMATYKTEIGNTSMYVLRSSAQKDGYITDKMYPATGRVTYDSTIFESNVGLGYDDGYFIITTTGSSNQAGQTIWQMNASKFNTVLNALMASANGYDWGDLSQGMINSLFNPMDYIVSCYWFPTSFSTLGGTSDTFTCGPWSSGVTCDIINNTQPAVSYIVNVPKHPQTSTRGEYVNLAPFTSYDLDLGFIGTISLDTTKLIDVSQFLVTIYRDPMTGTAKIEGRTITANNQQQLFSLTANYGVPINISSGKNNILNMLGDSLKMATSMAVGSFTGAMGGLIDMYFGSATESVIGTVTNSGSVGSLSGHRMPKRLFSRFFEIVDNDNARLGSPYCKVSTPATLTGYILPENCDISISGTEAEVARIKNIAQKGFFYE